jgi:hypothetical protein
MNGLDEAELRRLRKQPCTPRYDSGAPGSSVSLVKSKSHEPTKLSSCE